MNDSSDDPMKDDLLNSIRTTLDASVDSLDAQTRSRLNRIRQAALSSSKRRYRPWLIPGSVVGAATATMIVFTIGTTEPQSLPILEDIDLLSATETLELLDELDFYEWLEQVEAPVNS